MESDLLEDTPKASSAALLKGMLFGLVAAIVGSMLYAAVDIVVSTVMGMRGQVGYLGIALGLLIVKTMGIVAALLVGGSMLLGSKRQAGATLKWVAALFTYFAITLGVVPIPLWELHEQGQTLGHVSPGLIGTLVEYGLLSPLLSVGDDMTSGVIGLAFLVGSMYLAWRIMEKGNA